MKTYASAFSDEEVVSGNKVEEAAEEKLPPVPEADSQEDSDGSAQNEQESPKVESAEEGSVTSKDDEAELVEQAVANLTLPDPVQDTRPQPQKRQPNKITDVYYFYQAASGQHTYLHSLNARCLEREYGSLENCPPTITATVNHVDPCTMTEDLRSRLRYINHLPLTCEFQVAELDLKPPMVSKATLDVFKDEIERRRRDRKKKELAENRKLRKMQAEENRRAEQCPELRASLGGIQNANFPEIRSVIVPSAAPNLRDRTLSGSSSTGATTPVGSPTSSNSQAHAEENGDGGQTTSFSYSQVGTSYNHTIIRAAFVCVFPISSEVL